uniref:Cytotoxin homolog S4C8 n=1 Tax=Aspidelaps scutatus TaxID=8607 RepID=3SOD_ASPSC|nr:RecName: Full=Cytotoxin homolog S4C8 [Aspidelaps scutatus]
RKCFNSPGRLVSKPCPEGNNLCYKMSNRMYPPGFNVRRGCAETCPRRNRLLEVVCCCDTDNCNK